MIPVEFTTFSEGEYMRARAVGKADHPLVAKRLHLQIFGSIFTSRHHLLWR